MNTQVASGGGRRSGRRAGRGARLEQRAAPPAVNPAAPGQVGGAYRPLTEPEIKSIYDTAMRLNAELGINQVPPQLEQLFLEHGCTEDGNGRILIPQSLMEEAIDKAAKTFPLHARDPNRTIEIGGDKVYYGTGGAAVQTLDSETGLYRPSTLADLHKAARLCDALTNVAWYSRTCVATDVPDNFDLDVNTAYALVRNTTKHVGTSFTVGEHVAPIVALLDMVSGGEGKFAERPWLKAHITTAISPMRLGEDAVEVTFEAIKHNIPVNLITAAQAGATAPATLAGFLAQSTAETLASLLMVHVIKPGHPMIFSNWPFVVDLRTGAFAGGGAEIGIMNAAAAQIGSWMGLPTGVASSMTDAKAVDAQYGAEKAMTSLACGLAGANMVYESSGMTASLLGMTFEGFVLDDEMHGVNYRILRGVEVNEDNLAFDAICEAVRGDGHFLGGQHTYAAMERDYFYPKLADRLAPSAWAEEGAEDAWARAKTKAETILETHQPQYLEPALDAKLRDTFKILHP